MDRGNAFSEQWQSLHRVIAVAQCQLADKLRVCLERGPLKPDHYARYLSMQFHLTRGVQRYFLTAAAHADLAHRKPLRAFLCDFASEEELHFTLAENDLAAMGRTPEPEPFDVALWHAYFGGITVSRPFVRLGAACVLENLSNGEAREPLRKLLSSNFLDKDNTRFIVLHQHEILPHGDQILEALHSAALEQRQLDDLVEGARQGALMFLRFVDWALMLDPDEQALFADADHEATLLC